MKTNEMMYYAEQPHKFKYGEYIFKSSDILSIDDTEVVLNCGKTMPLDFIRVVCYGQIY